LDENLGILFYFDLTMFSTSVCMLVRGFGSVGHDMDFGKRHMPCSPTSDEIGNDAVFNITG
jgi:hypothetical protein